QCGVALLVMSSQLLAHQRTHRVPTVCQASKGDQPMKKTPKLLSDYLVQSAKPGDIIFDTAVTGLCIRAQATKKTWVLVYGPPAKRRKLTIGTYPATSLQ